jgi:hypothetical protein
MSARGIEQKPLPNYGEFLPFDVVSGSRLLSTNDGFYIFNRDAEFFLHPGLQAGCLFSAGATREARPQPTFPKADPAGGLLIDPHTLCPRALRIEPTYGNSGKSPCKTNEGG